VFLHFHFLQQINHYNTSKILVLSCTCYSSVGFGPGEIHISEEAFWRQVSPNKWFCLVHKGQNFLKVDVKTGVF